MCGDRDGKQYGCLASRDGREDADAFIFYGPDLDRELQLLPWPPRKLWALIYEESPMANYVLLQPEILRLFGATATFSRQSDFSLATQYIPSIDYLYSKEHVVSLKNKNKYRQEGLAPIVYLQSNCNVPSDRDRYVKELMKHIQVDRCFSSLDRTSLHTTTMLILAVFVHLFQLRQVSAQQELSIQFKIAQGRNVRDEGVGSIHRAVQIYSGVRERFLR